MSVNIGEIPTYQQAVGIGKRTARVYVPRIVHIDVNAVHVLIGVATHTAWRILARRYRMIRLKGKSAELHKLTGDIMRKWVMEFVDAQLGTGPGG